MKICSSVRNLLRERQVITWFFWGVGVVFGFLIACFLFDGCVAA